MLYAILYLLSGTYTNILVYYRFLGEENSVLVGEHSSMSTKTPQPWKILHFVSRISFIQTAKSMTCFIGRMKSGN
jgi:hypothetical protein